MLLLSKILLEKKEYSMFIERFLGALSMEEISPIFVDNTNDYQSNYYGLKEIFHYCRHKLRLLQTKRFGGSAAKDTSGLRLSLRAHPEVNVLIVAESNF